MKKMERVAKRWGGLKKGQWEILEGKKCFVKKSKKITHKTKINKYQRFSNSLIKHYQKYNYLYMSNKVQKTVPNYQHTLMFL